MHFLLRTIRSTRSFPYDQTTARDRFRTQCRAYLDAREKDPERRVPKDLLGGDEEVVLAGREDHKALTLTEKAAVTYGPAAHADDALTL